MTLHAEHATSLLVGLDADIVIGGIRGRALIVPPHTPYAAHCPGPTATYQFNPERCPRIAGFARSGGLRALDVRHAGSVVANLHALATPEVLAGVGFELERSLATGEAPRIDPRIARLLDETRDPAADRRTAIARTRMSPAHVRALFVRDIGIPMRTHALWRRLGHALGNIDARDMTATAHAVGFADLAHFSRTFRRMLGYSPTEFLANLVVG
jgi:AraC-like DNA-binding protein